MKKYNLQRLKALSGAVLLTATLTSCSKKEETQSLDIQIPNTAIDKFISSFEENREQALDCINEAREQQKEEVVIDLDEIREQIKASTYYSEEVKKFIEEFFAAGVVPDPSAFSEVAAGDIDYLHYLIIAGNTSAPLSYEIGILNTQVYKASEIQFFDNQRGLIPDLPNIIIPCMESNNYGNYIVYASNDFFIVAKNNGTIVAHTKDGFKEVYDYRYSLISLNDLLKRYGLDEFIKCEYSEIDLKNLRMILSKKIMGYKNRDTINVSNMLVIDTDRKSVV